MKRITLLLISILVFQSASLAGDYTKPNIITKPGLQVNSFTGNLFLGRSDLFIPARGIALDLTFSYNSGETNLDYGYGGGWTNTFTLLYERKGVDISIKRWDGQRDLFSYSGGIYYPPVGCHDSLIRIGGGFRLRTKSGMQYFFEDTTHNKVTRIVDRNGNAVTISYTGAYPSAITDASGRTILLVWSGGRLRQVQDFLSPPRTITYYYDATGNPIRVVNPAGGETRYTYNAHRCMIQVIDPRGSTYDITYNERGAVTRVHSPLSDETFSYDTLNTRTTHSVSGIQTTYAYDSLGHISEMAGVCCGNLRQFEYDNNGNITMVTDANGHATSYTHDNSGNKLTATDALGQTVTFTYEPIFDRLKSIRDRMGNLTVYSHDTKGNLVGVNRPLGVSESFTYNENGLMTSATDPNGNTTSYFYDSSGALIAVSHPIGSQSFAYDLAGNLVSHTDANGNSTMNTYDRLDQLISTQNPMGEVTSYAYDENGNRISESYPNGNVLTRTYDALGGITQVSDALGVLVSVTYDAMRRIQSTTDANGITTTYTYNATNLPVSKSKSGITMSCSYDPAGNLTSLVDGLGNTTVFAYDALNRPRSVTKNGTTLYTNYDINGNVIEKRDGNGNSTNYTYNVLNQLVSVWHADGIGWTYDRDANGNVIERTSLGFDIETFEYDEMDRLIKRADTDNYIYDHAGNLTSAYNDNATVTYTYNEANRLLSETMNGLTTSYSDNIAARQRTITYPGGTTVLETRDLRMHLIALNQGSIALNLTRDARRRLSSIGNETAGLRTELQYNELDRIQTITHRRIPGLSLIAGYDYEYDNVGNRILAEDRYDPSRSEVYTYDPLRALTSSRRGDLDGSLIPSPFDSMLISYDNAGNWTAVTSEGTTSYTRNNGNQYTSSSPGGAIGYDGNGNMRSWGHSNDAFLGNYDIRNQLLQGVDSVSQRGARLKHDPFGRRVQKEITTNGGASWLVDVKYYYSGNRVIEERASDNSIKATYLYGSESVDDVLATMRNGADYFYLKNAVGSIVAIADSAGTVIERYLYSAFGTPTILETSPSWCPGTIVLNGSFADSARAGAMPSVGRTDRWTRAYLSPDVKIPGGFDDSVYIGMYGNQATGEAIQQVMTSPFVSGHTYAISCAARWIREPNRPFAPQYAFRASNVSLTSPSDPNGVLIGVSAAIDTGGWVNIAIPDWVAPGNYNILTVSITNGSNVPNGDSVTYAHVDNICIRDLSAPKTRNSSIIGNRIMFTGREYDPEIRMYNYRARNYVPKFGRFAQPDPLGPWGDPPHRGNRYTYAVNSPTVFLDPLGKMTGEPVPGAEIFVEQEPNDEPIAADPTGGSDNGISTKPPWDFVIRTKIITDKPDPEPEPAPIAPGNCGPYSQSLSNLEDNGIIASDNNGPGGDGRPSGPPGMPPVPGTQAASGSYPVDFVGASVGDPSVIRPSGRGSPVQFASGSYPVDFVGASVGDPSVIAAGSGNRGPGGGIKIKEGRIKKLILPKVLGIRRVTRPFR